MLFRIWAEFTKMAEQQNKTIIITTHYIEEASQANAVSVYTCKLKHVGYLIFNPSIEFSY